jgi:hypothetical protein
MTRLFQQLNCFVDRTMTAGGGVHATVVGVPWKKDTERASNCEHLYRVCHEFRLKKAS